MKFKQYKKKSGVLIPIDLISQIPFNTKRIFLIYGKKNFIRGDHAHYKCSQYFVPILGKIQIIYENRHYKKKITMNHKNPKGLMLEPKTWCTVKFLTKSAILMVLCDRKYEFDDYIENYKLFKKILKKNNKLLKSIK